MWKEFKEFAMRGNVLDMAIGIIIGAAFGTIIKSLVDDILMPPIGLLIGNIDFKNLFFVIKPLGAYFPTPEAAQAAGAVSINYGRFINNIITFLIVAFSIFMFIKAMNFRRRREEVPAEVTTKDCPYCFSKISIKAVKCPECTADLK